MHIILKKQRKVSGLFNVCVVLAQSEQKLPDESGSMNGDDKMLGMSKEEKEQYSEAMMECQKDENEQYNKDQLLLKRIKECVNPEYFKDIEFELKESEHPSNYKIVDEPVGSCQIEGNYNIWVDQSCGCSGDDYSGTVCMSITDDKFLMWSYWM